MRLMRNAVAQLGVVETEVRESARSIAPGRRVWRLVIPAGRNEYMMRLGSGSASWILGK